METEKYEIGEVVKEEEKREKCPYEHEKGGSSYSRCKWREDQ